MRSTVNRGLTVHLLQVVSQQAANVRSVSTAAVNDDDDLVVTAVTPGLFIKIT